MYLKTLRECWQNAAEKTESLPKGIRIISRLGSTALDYFFDGAENEYSAYSKAIDQDNHNNEIRLAFEDELTRFKTPFGNLEAAIELDILISKGLFDIDFGD